MNRINMHYCVFRNTLQALREAYEDMADMDMDELSDEERSAFEQLVTLCSDIAYDHAEGNASLDAKKAPGKTDASLCPSCNRNLALPPHTCPYAEDIHNDSKSMCICCEECVHECLMDI